MPTRLFRRYSEGERFLDVAGRTFAASRKYLLATVVLLVLTGMFMMFGASPPTNSKDTVLVTIPEGASRTEVADLLKGSELIRSRSVFHLIVHIGFEGRQFISGTYQMRKDMPLFHVLEKLIQGDVAETRVTIPEGFTLRQIAERLGNANITNEKEFLQLAEETPEQFGVSSGIPTLEGFLFPDTYHFLYNQPADKVIRVMMSRMDQQLRRLEPYVEASGFSKAEILTIASLIEREAKVQQDRPLISSVIRNRLKLNMPLQIDATVIYAHGQHKNRVLYRDLDIESAYNTYRNRGLPPGPIANPGFASIEATVKPAQTDYLYYVAASDGSHLFARTFDEHKANTRKVRSR